VGEKRWIDWSLKSGYVVVGSMVRLVSHYSSYVSFGEIRGYSLGLCLSLRKEGHTTLGFELTFRKGGKG
jgi:hypothetical protein